MHSLQQQRKGGTTKSTYLEWCKKLTASRPHPQAGQGKGAAIRSHKQATCAYGVMFSKGTSLRDASRSQVHELQHREGGVQSKVLTGLYTMTFSYSMAVKKSYNGAKKKRQGLI